jgi:hypothetical protein
MSVVRVGRPNGGWFQARRINLRTVMMAWIGAFSPLRAISPCSPRAVSVSRVLTESRPWESLRRR